MDQEGKFLFSVARTECMGNAGESGKVLRMGCPALENLHFYEGQTSAASVCKSISSDSFSTLSSHKEPTIDGLSS